MSLQALIQFQKLITVDREITISNHCVSMVCAMSSAIIFVYVKISRANLFFKRIHKVSQKVVPLHNGFISL